ncbi:LPXTG cell wall anchor domain-containing protein [Enterococcus casseliflavus]|uniref:LPXTG cell wall anchor domain-containing protein n=1 Tax=Enterococcus casseliflavus TaxID=37734 RepID=UPI002DBB03B5|nr:LPXTG cell wall anchor domain-containing protein [Enterococcus casseliflavus]MEB6088241.1 LPXTG cell wall anchor domain-containing protein [Enterococcus casseliflavus]MEB6148772.1 LPXTG cell wall anchor domain-containing protein [Enterococcus casseliflavus]MEB8401812.1 LPXTG cell wall anchor domain-containing protein [Enterococcus casseliflavus]
MHKTIGRLIGTLVVLLALQFPLSVDGTQVQSVESEGSVGFTGVYKPIGPPDPPPSTSPQKPGGSLPQTNMTGGSFAIWVGSFLVAGVLVVVESKRRKATQKIIGMKAGNE